MLTKINPLSVYFAAESVEFDINGIQFVGEFYPVVERSPVYPYYFVLSANECSHPDIAQEYYDENWEDINSELITIYFERPSQPDVDSKNFVTDYKGHQIIYRVIQSQERDPGGNCDLFTSGFDVTVNNTFPCGKLFDTIEQAFYAVDCLTEI